MTRGIASEEGVRALTRLALVVGDRRRDRSAAGGPRSRTRGANEHTGHAAANWRWRCTNEMLQQ